MASRERCEQLLETIDAVLSECGKDPRRRSPSRAATRPAWGGPSWSQDPRLGTAVGHDGDHRPS